MTHARIDRMIDGLESKRKDLFDKLAAYDNSLLNKRPNEYAWSVIQVIDHLLISERASMAYVKKRLADRKHLHKVGLKEWGRSLALNMYLRSSKKFNVPAEVVPIVTTASLNEMRELWNAERHDMKEALDKVPDEMISHNWFKHPVAGRLSLAQMLSFTEAHYDRHVKQIWRTIDAVQ